MLQLLHSFAEVSQLQLLLNLWVSSTQIPTIVRHKCPVRPLERGKEAAPGYKAIGRPRHCGEANCITNVYSTQIKSFF